MAKDISKAISDSISELAEEFEMEPWLVTTYLLNFSLRYLIYVGEDKEEVKKYIRDSVDKCLDESHKGKTLH